MGCRRVWEDEMRFCLLLWNEDFVLTVWRGLKYNKIIKIQSKQLKMTRIVTNNAIMHRYLLSLHRTKENFWHRWQKSPEEWRLCFCKCSTLSSRRASISHCRTKLPRPRFSAASKTSTALLREWAQTHQREKRPGDSTYGLIQTPVVKSPHFPLP